MSGRARAAAGPAARGGGVFVSGAAARPPGGCARSVTRTPGLGACRPPARWRERQAGTHDGGPPRPSSARSLDRRRAALPRRPIARAPQGALAAGQGGAGRAAGAERTWCGPSCPPAGSHGLTDGQLGTAPGTGTRRGGRGARVSRAPAGREHAADTYLLPGLRRLLVRGRPGAAERLVAPRLAPAPHVAGRALRRVYIPRPLHVVPPSSLAIGRLGRRRLAPPGGAGPRLPSPRVAGKTRLPRGLGGPPSLPCGAEPQRPGAPRWDSEPEGGREPVGGAPSADCSRGARRWSVERGGGARSGRAALRPLGARPSVLPRALRAGQGAARADELGGRGRSGGGGEGARRGVSLRRMRAGRAGPGLYIELAPAPAEPSCRGSGGEEVLAAGGCGREGVLGWREPRERRNGGPESWEPARGDCVPQVGPCLTGSVSGGPGEARGEGTPSEGPRESLSGHPHLGKISRARGWRCGSLYGVKNS